MSSRKSNKVLLLGDVPVSALQFWASRGDSYEVEHCQEDLTEAQIAKKIAEYNVVCLRYARTRTGILADWHRFFPISAMPTVGIRLQMKLSAARIVCLLLACLAAMRGWSILQPAPGWASPCTRPRTGTRTAPVRAAHLLSFF